MLPSERLFREDPPLNINDPEDQAGIERAIEELRSNGRAPDVVVFDNLSSLSGGVDENHNSALDALLRWLVSLRHKGFVILPVHHAGKVRRPAGRVAARGSAGHLHPPVAEEGGERQGRGGS